MCVCGAELCAETSSGDALVEQKSTFGKKSNASTGYAMFVLEREMVAQDVC